jgi:hypothetical protein
VSNANTTAAMQNLLIMAPSVHRPRIFVLRSRGRHSRPQPASSIFQNVPPPWDCKLDQLNDYATARGTECLHGGRISANLASSRSVFAAIADDLDFINAQLARIPTRKELARLVLLATLATAAFVLCGIEVLFRFGPVVHSGFL